jgi:hypothetical protein
LFQGDEVRRVDDRRISMTTIQCRCGAVRVELTSEPIAQFYCHCDDCQAAHGAAYIPIMMYSSDAVKVTKGDPSAWALKRTPRRSCPECGTRVFAEVPGLGVRGVSALLLPAGQFKPAFHIQCQFAMLPVVDSLPHYKAFPASFGGSDEVVDW